MQLKTKNLFFGKPVACLHETNLNGNNIDWVTEWTYLGVSLKSGKTFGCSVADRIKFYQCANAIFWIDGRSDKPVMLRLVETHCFPLLMYATEVIHVANNDERRQLRVAYHCESRQR